MDLSLIDRIYECAFAPEFWPEVMDEFAKICDARGGILITANGATEIPVWAASQNMRENVEQYVEGGIYKRSLTTKRLIESRYAGFIRDADVNSAEEMANDPLYHELLWPAGLGCAVGTIILAPTGDKLMCLVQQERVKGPVELANVQRLDALRPHLARSALLSSRLRLERARAVADTLELLGFPALVFAFDGRVLAANALIEAETAYVRWRAQDRVALSNKTADAMFQQALETVSDDRAAVRSFAIRDAGAVAAKVAHVVPIRGAARDVFVRCAGVLMLTPVAAPKSPPVELIQSLFDLTPAEAGVARSLTSGETLQRIAVAGRVSTNTVRTHLRSVFEKTGCGRQAELVALLGGLATPGASGPASDM